MKTMILAALLGATASVAAQADTLTLATPMSGGTLHAGAVDMSVYWLPAADDTLEVVAYYTERGDDAAPRLLQMRLGADDRVVFGLPGQPGTAYSFQRNDGALHVTSAPVQSGLTN
ncbi:hypothetical protein FDP22_06940 [Paroceanicella profunda]|uniref:S9 family peptidase n=1 Tax=Paroceanicella profunda TaxID=2579971 RepID=A0A5B8FWG0_9RHOB|nr:hypothetical protein [Paroceanicella profunda]QDL91540.1 hypothetical protein FDP22_06940 [Paroceanicella profunda]